MYLLRRVNDFLGKMNGLIFLKIFNFLCFVFLGLHLRHMEVPSLGVQSELELSAYATATATQDPSRVCILHHSLRQ